MTNYRAIVRHVRYWRGSIHRWSTSYQFTGTWSGGPTSNDCQNILAWDDGMCWGASAADGGTYEVQIYNVDTGGVPLASFTAFDYLNPSDWVQYSGLGWGSGHTKQVTEAECALLVEWAAGTSSSGKPVTFRKWFHAVPLSTATTAGGEDILGTEQSSLATRANNLKDAFAGSGVLMGTPSGRLAGLATVSAYFGNHQMPRGRRRKTLAPGVYKSGGRSVIVPGPLQVD